MDPDLPLAGVKTIDEIVDESLAIVRFSMVLFASFAVLGLLLAAVGIYGVMAFGVAQRTQEFGVRMALGAQRSRVVSMVLKEATILAVLGGALIGLVGAYLVGRAMQSTLYGVGGDRYPRLRRCVFRIVDCGMAGMFVSGMASQQSRTDGGLAERLRWRHCNPWPASVYTPGFRTMVVLSGPKDFHKGLRTRQPFRNSRSSELERI